MSIKGIDQRPYDREKFNSEFDRIFKKGKKDDSERNGAKASAKVRNNSADGSTERL